MWRKIIKIFLNLSFFSFLQISEFLLKYNLGRINKYEISMCLIFIACRKHSLHVFLKYVENNFEKQETNSFIFETFNLLFVLHIWVKQNMYFVVNIKLHIMNKYFNFCAFLWLHLILNVNRYRSWGLYTNKFTISVSHKSTQSTKLWK